MQAKFKVSEGWSLFLYTTVLFFNYFRPPLHEHAKLPSWNWQDTWGWCTTRDSGSVCWDYSTIQWHYYRQVLEDICETRIASYLILHDFNWQSDVQEFERLTLSEPWRGAGVRSAFKRVEKPCVIQEMQRNITEHLRANGVFYYCPNNESKCMHAPCSWPNIYNNIFFCY